MRYIYKNLEYSRNFRNFRKIFLINRKFVMSGKFFVVKNFDMSGKFVAPKMVH